MRSDENATRPARGTRNGNHHRYQPYPIRRQRGANGASAALGMVGGDAAVLLSAAALAKSLAANLNLQWDVVGKCFFSSQILAGLVRTLELTALAMVIGIVIGVVTAVRRLSPIR